MLHYISSWSSYRLEGYAVDAIKTVMAPGCSNSSDDRFLLPDADFEVCEDDNGLEQLGFHQVDERPTIQTWLRDTL